MKRCVALLLLLSAFILSACGNSGKVRCPYSYNNYGDYDLSTIQAAFSDAGFTNITVKNASGGPYNKVSALTVGGKLTFTISDYFDPSAPVVITYHPEKQEKPEPTPEPEPMPEPAPELSPEEIKAYARECDSAIMSNVSLAEGDYSTFVSAVTSGKLSDLEMYNLSSVAKGNLENYTLLIQKLDGGESSAYADYRRAASRYVYAMYTVADEAMSYIDEPKTSKLSEMQTAMTLVNDYLVSVASARMSYLSANGFSADEIAEIAEPAE